MTLFRLTVVVFMSVCAQAFGQAQLWSNSQTSFWSNSIIPAIPEENESSPLTMGLRFYSDVAGSITGVRFYKGPANTGPHVGSLWSGTGTLLASVTFSTETASGWQQANFSTPVAIAANVTYVISYSAPKGAYAVDRSYSWSTLDAESLHVSGSSPGVYAYGSGNLFPNTRWNNSNYWVDVVFSPSTTTPVSGSGTSQPTQSTYVISGTAGIASAAVTLFGAASASTTTNSSGGYSFTGVSNGLYIVAPSKAGYTFLPSTAAVNIDYASITSVNFTAVPVPVPIPHSVTLSWTGSPSGDLKGYNIYRADVAGDPFTKLNLLPLPTTTYVDLTVVSGRTYYYVATTVSLTGESAYSNQATAQIPIP